MPYEGETLVDLVSHAEEATTRAGERLAIAMLRHGKQRTQERTPVQTHHLRESYRLSDVRRKVDNSVAGRAYAWTGRIWTEVEYAEHVERGTGLWGPRRKKYIIKPKTPGGTLAFPTMTPNGSVIMDVEGAPTAGGKTVMVRFVMHPGSPGHHMFKIGAQLTEREIEDWATLPMRLWSAEIEGRA